MTRPAKPLITIFGEETADLNSLIPMWDNGECLSSDPELFFPLDAMMNKYAKRICAPCTEKGPCLEYALKRGLSGVWGGTTTRERAIVRKRAAKALA